MNTKKDGQGKDGGKPAEAPGTKKPYATLDLKATEIKSESKDAKPEATAAVPPAGQPGPAARKDEQKPAPVEAKAPSASPAKPADAKPQPAQPQAPQSAKAAAAPPPPAPARSGIGGLLSHITAGIVGGFLALLGADTIGQQLGLQIAGGSSQVTEQLQQRLASIESGMKAQAPQTDLAQKLAATEAKLQKLDEVARSVVAIGEAQSKLAGEARVLAGKVAGQDDPSARIAKLEDTLATIAAAATSDPQSGRVPQIAAIAGKLQDLEKTLATQIAVLRRGVTQEIDTRIAQTAEASEAAKAGAQRIDRDLAGVRTDAARLTQRVEGLTADAERAGQTLRVLQEETGGLKSALNALKGDFDSRLKTLARPDDVSGAVAPVASKLAALESSVQSVVKSEQDRRATAERIVLALELNNLKRMIDRGQKYGAELAEVRRVSGTKVDLSVLDRFKDTGVPALTDLARDFRALSHKIIEAEMTIADASVVDKLLAGAKSIVRVRKTEHAAGDRSAEAVTARMEAALKDGRLAAVLDEAKALSEKSLAAAGDWLGRVEARSAVDRAIAAIEAELKTSLSAAAPAKASN